MKSVNLNSLEELRKLDVLPELELYCKPTKLKKKPLTTTKRMVKYLRQLFDEKTFRIREEIIVIACTADLDPVGYFSLAKGDKGEVNADFHYLFQMLILCGADGFIYAHNHPMAKALPSQQDLEFTNTLRLLTGQLNFKLIDHIILNEDEFYSFDDNGMFYS